MYSRYSQFLVKYPNIVKISNKGGETHYMSVSDLDAYVGVPYESTTELYYSI